MTLRTSFFNKGIYKSALKRYLWGSILYFIILFFSTGLALFLNMGRGIYNPLEYSYYKDSPLIFQGSYMALPMLLAMVVPTVAALLIFRFLHSKKQAVFIHSLPVNRTAIFTSSIFAGFTLMLAPVVLNGIILMGISLSDYGVYFSAIDCLKWIGYNALGIFMMFSCAVFSANLTGNSFATVALNGLIHGFLFLTVATFSIMADVFIYGFTEMNNFIEKVGTGNFFVTVFSFSNEHFRNGLTFWDFAKYIIASAILYALAYFLYRKRRMETVGDVAGFKCLNPIFKYLVTFLATMFGFAGLASYIGENPFVFAIIIAVIGIVAYVGSEMILKKTLNVMYSWKGYIAYALVFSGIICVFAFSSFFGYETRVPNPSEVESVAVYEYYRFEEPYSEENEIIESAVKIHREFTEGYIPKINDYGVPRSQLYTRIHIKYNLKNGKSLTRVYPVSIAKRNEIMNRLYAFEEYRKMCEEVFVEESLIKGVFVNDKVEIAEYDGLLEAIRKDTMDMRYEKLHPMQYNEDDILYGISIEYKVIEKDGDNKPYSYLSGIYVQITRDYENTVKWLWENGFKFKSGIMKD